MRGINIDSFRHYLSGFRFQDLELYTEQLTSGDELQVLLVLGDGVMIIIIIPLPSPGRNEPSLCQDCFEDHYPFDYLFAPHTGSYVTLSEVFS